MKVIARGLLPPCKTEEIFNDFKENGLKIISCTNILRKGLTINEEGI